MRRRLLALNVSSSVHSCRLTPSRWKALLDFCGWLKGCGVSWAPATAAMASSTGTDRERSISPRAWASVRGGSASLAAGYARPVPNYDGEMAARTLADLLLVFLKEPRPGAVKSRLAARIGAEAAAAVYRAIAD